MKYVVDAVPARTQTCIEGFVVESEATSAAWVRRLWMVLSFDVAAAIISGSVISVLMERPIEDTCKKAGTQNLHAENEKVDQRLRVRAHAPIMLRAHALSNADCVSVSESGRQDSNLRSRGPQPRALPDYATPRWKAALTLSSARAAVLDVCR
jgi:hypothetical protein